MVVKYDPDVQGRELSNDDINRLTQLKPDFSSFSLDEPELTEDLVKRMKDAKKKKEQPITA